MALFFNSYIGYDRTEEDMEGRVCTCPEENENVDPITGDGSSWPCMSDGNGMDGYPTIRCCNCIWCQKKEL